MPHRRERWRDQPAVPLRVDLDHPLARGIIEFGYTLGSGVPYSAIRELKPSRVGAVGTVQTPHGTAIDTSGTGNYINLGRNLSASSAVATCIVRTTLPETLQETILFTSALQSGANYVGHWASLSGTGVFRGAYGDGGGTAVADYRQAVSAAGTVISGPYTLAAVCRAATDWSLYANGVSTGTPTYSGSGGAYSAGTQNGTINFRSANAFYGTQSASSWAFFNRALTDAEIFALYQAPFQILQPIRRRVFVAVSVGGQTLTPSLFTNSNTFYAPTVSGTYTLSPGLYTDSDTFYSPTVSTSYSITPGLYTDSDTFYSSTVSATYTLTPSLYSDGDAFPTPTVSTSYTVTPDLYTDTDTFYTHVVSLGGTQSLAPSIYTDADTFYSATVTSTYVLVPALHTDPDTFYSHTVGSQYTISPTLYVDADTFYTPVVALASQILQPALYIDADTFYAATVGSSYTLLPSLYPDPDTFYVHTVTGGLGTGLGQVTRYVTVEFSDSGALWRTNIARDIIIHSTRHSKINFSYMSPVDRIQYKPHTDRIFYSRA